MRHTVILLAALFALPVLAQEPAVRTSSIWSDTVKRGDMLRQVRGLGTVTGSRAVALQIAETQVKEIQPGQEVSVNTKQTILKGQVARVDSAAVNGVVTVAVTLNSAPPANVQPGLPVDGTILIGRLANVVYVGRPVFGNADKEETLFRVDADGLHATRVKVRFGRSSVNTIQILEGLQPGDRVILSDMRAYEGQARIRLQ